MVPAHLSAIVQFYQEGGLPKVKKKVRGFLTRRYPFTVAKLRYHRKQLTLMPAFHPFAVYDVNPNAIDQYLPYERFGAFANAGCVLSGEWDKDTDRIETHEKYRTIVRYFEGEVAGEDLTYEYLRQHGYPKGEARAYAEYGYADYLDDLYRSIASGGVRLDHPNATARPAARFDQVVVNISRDGQLIFDDVGCHRLTIAAHLGLDRIPVRINVVHGDWYETHGTPRSHPELEYITRIPIGWRDLSVLDTNPNIRLPWFRRDRVDRAD